jgi:hypothetical protein
MVRRIIKQLYGLVNQVDKLHHTIQKLRPSTATLRTIIHFDLDQTRLGLLLFIHRIPFSFDCIHHKITRFI